MAAPRTRSEYRLAINPDMNLSAVQGVSTLADSDRDGLAHLMLDAYRDTVDDEGETLAEAFEAVDEMLGQCIRAHSFVLTDDELPIAMSLVTELRGVHYINPVAVAAEHKGAGLGRRMVETSLASLIAAEVTELGATITDGNEPSERLFASLGAVRVGPYPAADLKPQST